MKKILTLLFVNITLGLFAQQTATIKGRVTDPTDLPLAGVKISLDDDLSFTYTDNNGFYSLQKVDSSAHTIVVDYLGLENQTIKVPTLTDGETKVLDIQLKADIQLNTVQIQGTLNGTARALNQQKNMINVGNIISAEQVEQFPDDNMGDALKRVPGVNVQYDQGEPRFGNIRGLAPDLNSVTVDGNKLPSAEGETRAFQLDLISADMVKSIEVNKVVTPDMDGDAIGASVNLVPRSIPTKMRIKAKVTGGYNTIRNKANYKASLLYGQRFLNDALGVTLNSSIFNNYIGSENYEAEWEKDGGKNNEAFTSDYQIRKYELQRLRQNYNAAFDLKINKNHRIELKGSYNQRDDYENRFRLRYKGIKWDKNENSYTSEIRRQTKGGTLKNARLEKQKLMNISLNGTHDFSLFKMDWGYFWSKASEERPHERYIELKNKGVNLSTNYNDLYRTEVFATDSNNQDIQNFKLKELTEEFQWTQEEDQTFNVNFKVPLKRGFYENSIKIGGKARFKKKLRDNSLIEYEPKDENSFLSESLNNTSDHTDNNFQAIGLPLGSFINPSYLGNLDLTQSGVFDAGDSDLKTIAGNYNAKEDVYASYIRFDQKWGKKFHLVGGLRLEKTTIKYNGYIVDTDLGLNDVKRTGEQNKDFTNWMPSLLLKYKPTKLWNFKFGVTKTFARPRYFDLVPYQIRNTKDDEIKIGNPDLQPTESINIDLMTERYFKNVGLLEFGVFYKNITDFISEERYKNYNFDGTVWKEFKRPINAGNAKVLGLEIGLQKNLDFISSLFKSFSLYTNYTYTHSKVSKFNIEGRTNEDISLTGSPEHTMNASLAYETESIVARVSYNHASSFVDEFGQTAFYDRYYDAVNYLDFNINYNITQQFTIFFKANNLLNQPLRYYQGEQSRTMQVEYYGPKYKLGVLFNL